MDWRRAVERNAEALMGIALTLLSMLGGPEGAETLTRRRRSKVTRILRSAESAARRVIYVAALKLLPDGGPRTADDKCDVPFPVMHDEDGFPLFPVEKIRDCPTRINHVRIELGLARRWDGSAPAPARKKPAAAPSDCAFALFDPPKRFDDRPRRKRPAIAPRLFSLAPDARYTSSPAPSRDPMPWDPVDAGPLRRRVMALHAALRDIEASAKRLLRLQARRARIRHCPATPMRPGAPPGARKRGRHEVDDLLRECRWLANFAIAPPDSS